MNPVERAIRRVDRYQQEHDWLGFPFGVIKKYGDDNGGRLTALLTYSAFFALLPLLLLLVTVLGFALGHDAALRERVVHSALAEFPIIGTQLGSHLHSLRAAGLGLVIGIAGLIWGARGLTQAAQHSMAEVWNIPGVDRPNFWTRQLRGAVLLAVLALGLVATTLLTALAGARAQPPALHAAEIAASAALNTGLSCSPTAFSLLQLSVPAGWSPGLCSRLSAGWRCWPWAATWSTTSCAMPATSMDSSAW
jgi:uncharacterized BrkB/YihY/UPF0761 family membrane protein